MKFVPDYTVPAVDAEAKQQYGEKGAPKHVRPVVTVNPKSLARKRAAVAASRDPERSGSPTAEP